MGTHHPNDPVVIPPLTFTKPLLTHCLLHARHCLEFLENINSLNFLTSNETHSMVYVQRHISPQFSSQGCIIRGESLYLIGFIPPVTGMSIRLFFTRLLCFTLEI